MDNINRKITFGIIFFSLLLDLVGFAMILPLFPSLLDHYSQQNNDELYKVVVNVTTNLRIFVGAPDIQRWNSVLFGGILGSLFCFLQFLSSALVGSISDVYGRKPLLLLSAAGVSGSYLLWFFSSKSFTLFTASRILGGLSKANVGVAIAAISDVSDLQSRGKGMALVGIAFSLGFLLGPILGVAVFSPKSLLADASSKSVSLLLNPAFASFSLSTLNFLFLLIFLKETLPINKRSKSIRHGLSRTLSLINPVSLFSFSTIDTLKFRERQSLRFIGSAYFIFLLIYSGLEFNLTFLTHLRFAYSSVDQGKMFCVIGVLTILIQSGIGRRVPSNKSVKIAMTSMLISIPAFVLLGIAVHHSIFYIGIVLFSFSCLVVSCLTVSVSLSADQQHQGAALGILRSLGALARSIGPLVTSVTYWLRSAEITYVAGAFVLLLPIYLLTKVNFNHQTESTDKTK